MAPETEPAQRFLVDLSGGGLHVAMKGTGIWVTPRERITEDIAQTIRDRKSELLAYLQMEKDICERRLQEGLDWLQQGEPEHMSTPEYQHALRGWLRMLDVYEKACEMGRAT